MSHNILVCERSRNSYSRTVECVSFSALPILNIKKVNHFNDILYILKECVNGKGWPEYYFRRH